jgi:hypothetical protein
MVVYHSVPGITLPPGDATFAFSLQSWAGLRTRGRSVLGDYNVVVSLVKFACSDRLLLWHWRGKWQSCPACITVHKMESKFTAAKSLFYLCVDDHCLGLLLCTPSCINHRLSGGLSIQGPHKTAPRTRLTRLGWSIGALIYQQSPRILSM